MAHDGEDAELCRVLGSLYPEVVNFACSLTHNLADAEDVAQDACLRAWDGRRRYFQRADANVGGWLLRVARNIVIDRVRQRHAISKKADGALPGEQLRLRIPDPEAVLALDEGSDKFARVLAALDYVDRAFLAVWAEQAEGDGSREDAAEELGFTMAEYEAAKKRLKRRLDAVVVKLGISFDEFGDDKSFDEGER